jgi:hypothetical protein
MTYDIRRRILRADLTPLSVPGREVRHVSAARAKLALLIVADHEDEPLTMGYVAELMAGGTSEVRHVFNALRAAGLLTAGPVENYGPGRTAGRRFTIDRVALRRLGTVRRPADHAERLRRMDAEAALLQQVRGWTLARIGARQSRTPTAVMMGIRRHRAAERGERLRNRWPDAAAGLGTTEAA